MCPISGHAQPIEKEWRLSEMSFFDVATLRLITARA